MTLHLTWWWLWWPLIVLWAIGVIAGLLMSAISDGPWYERLLIIIWPLTLAVMFLGRLALFLIGRD